MRKRIAVAGFQHETNTFAPILAPFEEFEKHDGWPGLTRGEALFDATAGLNLPLTGFVEAARGAHHLVPILWCSAEPSSYVTDDAFDRVTGMICDALRAAGPLDAVYLDLHGAMVTQSFEDGDGEVLRRVRSALGGTLPVVASLDFHANLTESMIELADALAVYRTYPHLDMARTGARAFSLLEPILAGSELHKGLRKLPYLIPLPAQCTDFEPNRALYGRVAKGSSTGRLSLDFAEGFPASDIRECGPGVLAYGEERGRVEDALQGLTEAALAAEADFDNAMLSPDEAVEEALRTAGGPVVLADAQDNPGAGGTSDTTGVLAALVRHEARGAVLALMHDPEVARAAHEVGEGGRFRASLGGKHEVPGSTPFEGGFEVLRLGDGVFTCNGQMYRGTRTDLGPMALLRVEGKGGVRVVVGSKRFQCLDRAVFTHVGVRPAEEKILVVKSTVHFRADFDPIAVKTLVVAAPGANLCRPSQMGYRRLRPGVRLEPMGAAFEPPAAHRTMR